MKALSEQIAAKLRPKGARVALLQLVGFGCLSYAAGMWLLPVGVAVAGVSLLVMSWLLD